MPTNTPDQQVTIPIGADAANNPLAFIDMIADVEGRLVLKYANEADRTARHTAPVEGDLTHLASENRYDTYDGANYVSAFTRSLYAAVARTTDTAAIVSNTTLASDATLTVALPAAGRFEFEEILFYDSSTTADFKVAFTWPAGATVRWGVQGLSTTAVATVGDGQFGTAIASGTAVALGGAGVGTANTVMAIVKGVALMGGTAGNLVTQYAQNTSDATNTVVRTGCRLHVWRAA